MTRAPRLLVLLLLLGPATAVPLAAASKYTMPDFYQDENTCFPAAASNLICWFGQNGYPKLLADDLPASERHKRLFTQLLVNCNVSYKNGTRYSQMAKGLTAFFKEHGYPDAKVSYQGFGGTQFSDPRWLERNSQDNAGFILCIDYVRRKPGREYVNAEDLGHCITLVTYSDSVAVILDPAHGPDERSRYTVRLQPIRDARFTNSYGSWSMPLVYELDGVPLGYRPADTAILTGAFCIELPTPATSAPPAQAVGQKP